MPIIPKAKCQLINKTMRQRVKNQNLSILSNKDSEHDNYQTKSNDVDWEGYEEPDS